MNSLPDIAIVGGGLAGMSAALRLLERGCRVSIFDANTRLGGKAGADKNGDHYDDHGYHIFPAWYLNTWHLVDELGIRANFADCAEFSQLYAGEFPKLRTLRNLTSASYFLQNLTSGVMPKADMVLFYYSTLDLISQHYNNRALLDQITVTGFIRSRFYRTERVALELQDLMLKGITVPSYFVSAMTLRKVLQYWAQYPLPMFRILRGNLQQFFINVIERRLRDMGCNIYTSHHLEGISLEGNRVSKLRFRVMGASASREVNVGKLILAIPAERLAMLLDDELYAAAPRLSSVRYIRTQPMAALNIYLGRRLPGIPRVHVNLMGSKFGLSFIDVSQVWQGYDYTVLNLIASDFTPLESLSSEEVTDMLIGELRRYIPTIASRDIARTHLQTHEQAPLFRNDVGTWQFRPDARTELSNLYLAGDYCRSHVDLVSMESAITTGLRAAEALRKDVGIAKPVHIIEPLIPSRHLLLLAKFALMPVAAAAKLVTVINAQAR